MIDNKKENKPPNLRYPYNDSCYWCAYGVASPVDLFCKQFEMYIPINNKEVGLPVCDDFQKTED